MTDEDMYTCDKCHAVTNMTPCPACVETRAMTFDGYLWWALRRVRAMGWTVPEEGDEDEDKFDALVHRTAEWLQRRDKEWNVVRMVWPEDPLV